MREIDLAAALQRQLLFSQALNSIAKVLVTHHEANTILDEVCHTVSATLHADKTLIYDIRLSENKAIGLCEYLNPEYPSTLSSKGTYDLSVFSAALAEILRTHAWVDMKNTLWYPFAFHQDGFHLLIVHHIDENCRTEKRCLEEADFLNSVSQLVNVALEKIKLIETSKDLTFYDQLTHLPNRRLLMKRIAEVQASNVQHESLGALLFIDLDKFKNINDTQGHHVGDLVLQEVGKRLQSCVRHIDTVARLGGDEFVVLLKDLSSEQTSALVATENIANKILTALRKPFYLQNHQLWSTPSVGIILFGGLDDPNKSPEDLLRQADIAMHCAKREGRNNLRFFDASMQNVINHRTELERDLQIAMLSQQFELHYQIQVNQALQPVGAEALVRWKHPVRGLVSPLDFISSTEETGLIHTLGLWILNTACAQIKLWKKDTAMCHLVLSVNVSAQQFRQSDFVDQVIHALEYHAIDPHHLKLELTESLLLDDVEQVIASMEQLNARGVQFSLDDFGTGYSSLQYIKRLPLSCLKIDRTFVHDLHRHGNDMAIVGTIIAMAHCLKMSVIAEGVETLEQQEILRELGCESFQGYLYGKPVPIGEFNPLQA